MGKSSHVHFMCYTYKLPPASFILYQEKTIKTRIVIFYNLIFFIIHPTMSQRIAGVLWSEIRKYTGTRKEITNSYPVMTSEESYRT